MIDRETNYSRGFGFVTFDDISVAQAVLGGPGKATNKITMKDKECEVKVSIPKKIMDTKRTDRKQKYGYRDGESFHGDKHNFNRNSHNSENSKNKGFQTSKEGNAQARNFKDENVDMKEIVQDYVDNDVNNQTGKFSNRATPPYLSNYNYFQGNSLMVPAYTGQAGMIMCPTNFVPQAQFAPSAPPVFFEQNGAYPPIPFVAPGDMNGASYQQGYMIPPYVMYPFPYPQMMYHPTQQDNGNMMSANDMGDGNFNVEKDGI